MNKTLPGNNHDVQDSINRIDQLRKEGATAEAEKLLHSSINYAPGHPGLRHREALMSLDKENYSLAVSQFRQIIKNHPDFYWAKAQLLNTFILNENLENTKEVDTLIESVLERDHINSFALKAKLILAVECREFSNIQRVLRQAQVHYPRNYKFVNICKDQLSQKEQKVIFEACADLNSIALLHSLARLYVDMNDKSQAILLLKRVLDIDPEYEPVHRLLLRVINSLELYDELDYHIELARPWVSDKELVDSYKASSLYKRQRFYEALKITKTLVESPGVSDGTKALHGWILLSTGQYIEYENSLGMLDSTKSPVLYSNLQYRLGRFSESIQTIKSAWEQDKSNLSFVALYSQHLRSVGRVKEASELLSETLKTQRNKGLSEQLVLAYAELKEVTLCKAVLAGLEHDFDYDASLTNTLFIACITLRSDLDRLSVFQKKYQDQPESNEDLSRYLDILRIMGKHEEASRLDKGFLQQKPLGNSKSLKDSISDITIPENKQMIHNTWFAWEFADKSAWSFDDWYNRAYWGSQANALIADCFLKDCQLQSPNWNNYPVKSRDLSKIDQLLEQGNGLIAISSHHGPVAASMIELRRNNYSITVIATTGRELDTQFRVSFLTEDSVKEIRKISKRLNQNEVVISSPDLSHGKGGISFDFLNGKLELAPLYPRLMYRHQTPSVWMQAFWDKDNNIQIDLQLLPAPEDSETEAEFIQRWGNAYISRLENHLKGDPANLAFIDKWQSWV